VFHPSLSKTSAESETGSSHTSRPETADPNPDSAAHPPAAESILEVSLSMQRGNSYDRVYPNLFDFLDVSCDLKLCRVCYSTHPNGAGDSPMAGQTPRQGGVE